MPAYWNCWVNAQCAMLGRRLYEISQGHSYWLLICIILKYVWNLHLYTMKRHVLCTSHMVANLNCIHLKQIIKKKHLQVLTKMFMAVLEFLIFPHSALLGLQSGGSSHRQCACHRLLLHGGFFPEGTDACCANRYLPQREVCSVWGLSAPPQHI